MNFLTDSLDTPVLVTLIIGCVILLSLIIVFFIFRFRASHLKKTVRDIDVKSGELVQNAGEYLTSLLNRFYFISQSNEDYIELYESFKDEREAIVAKYDNLLADKITRVKDFYLTRKYKLTRIELTDAWDVYRAYQKEIDALERKMNVYLQKEDECRTRAVPYQRRFRAMREFYMEHKEELIPVSESVLKVFTKIENTFEEFEELSSSAHYDEATSKLSILDKVLSALENSLEKMPPLCARLELVIPKKIQDLRTRYAELEKEKYPLHHLRVNGTLDDIEHKILALEAQLSNFSLKNVDVELDIMDESILYITNAFDVEEEARRYFDSNYDPFYKKSYDLEKFFLKLKRTLPEYKKIYWIQEKYIEILSNLQTDISKLGNTKRELDTYIHSSSMQPYSILKKKLEGLGDDMRRIENIQNEFNEYLKSLKRDSDYAYEFLNSKFVLLKQLDYRLRNMKIPYIQKSLKNEFASAFSYLENIGMLIQMAPINVEAVNTALTKAKDSISYIEETISSQETKMKEAEDAVVYANRYRQEFHDVQVSLLRAEKFFSDGDFASTLDEAVSTIRKMNPEVSK